MQRAPRTSLWSSQQCSQTALLKRYTSTGVLYSYRPTPLRAQKPSRPVLSRAMEPNPSGAEAQAGLSRLQLQRARALQASSDTAASCCCVLAGWKLQHTTSAMLSCPSSSKFRLQAQDPQRLAGPKQPLVEMKNSSAWVCCFPCTGSSAFPATQDHVNRHVIFQSCNCSFNGSWVNRHAAYVTALTVTLQQSAG